MLHQKSSLVETTLGGRKIKVPECYVAILKLFVWTHIPGKPVTCMFTISRGINPITGEYVSRRVTMSELFDTLKSSS